MTRYFSHLLRRTNVQPSNAIIRSLSRGRLDALSTFFRSNVLNHSESNVSEFGDLPPGSGPLWSLRFWDKRVYYSLSSAMSSTFLMFKYNGHDTDIIRDFRAKLTAVEIVYQ